MGWNFQRIDQNVRDSIPQQGYSKDQLQIYKVISPFKFTANISITLSELNNKIVVHDITINMLPQRPPKFKQNVLMGPLNKYMLVSLIKY